MSELALPDPQTTTLAQYGDVARQAAEIRAYCAEAGDAKTADELRRRLAAFERYVTDREVRKALAAESRMTERLIGQLLGPADGPGRPKNAYPVINTADLNTRHRVEFRRLAWREDGSELPEAEFMAVLDAGTERSKMLSGIERARLARLAQQEQAAAENGAAPEPRPAYLAEGVHHAAIREAVALVEPDSIDVIVTDPPYGEAAVAAYAELAAFASHALRPGGSLAVMVGQFHLPAALTHLGTQLHYHWTLAYLTPGGQAPQIFPRKVNTFWKPILWFVKGTYEGPWLGDVVRSAVNDNDKTRHRWGQSESGMTDLVERFSSEGELVCDPYCGAGTTGVAALRLGRRFLGFDREAAEVDVARGRLLEMVA